MGGVLRSRRGQLAAGGVFLAALIVVLVLLLTGGKKPGTAGAANSPGASAAAGSSSSSPRSSGSGSSDAASANTNGPTFAVGAAEDCLKTSFGSDSVSDFPGPQSSISLYRRARTVVDIEGEGEGSQSSTGTLLFFVNSSKAAAALPGLTRRDKGVAVNQPNHGNVVFIAGHLAADAQVSVMGCLQ